MLEHRDTSICSETITMSMWKTFLFFGTRFKSVVHARRHASSQMNRSLLPNKAMTLLKWTHNYRSTTQKGHVVWYLNMLEVKLIGGDEMINYERLVNARRHASSQMNLELFLTVQRSTSSRCCVTLYRNSEMRVGPLVVSYD